MNKTPEKNDEDALIRPYVADGIREFDHRLPRWWLGLLYGTIAFAAVYMIRFYILGAPSLEETYNSSVAASKLQRAAAAAAEQQAGGPALGERLRSPELIAQGKEVFLTNCLPCHGAHGEGNIGPNLTDDFWIHGGKDEDIIRTITQGVPDKGMPPWGPVLGDKKVEQAAAFVISLHGSNPPNGKAPQGERYERKP